MATEGYRIDIPTFDNTIGGYQKFRNRAMLFRDRMKLEKKQSQATLLLLGSLTGIAWDTCGSLA